MLFSTLWIRKSRISLSFSGDDSCLSCHASSRTKNEPGFFIRSIFPDEEGEPIARAGEDRVNHTTDLGIRWGGWFVTAEKFNLPHRGNGITKKTEESYSVSPVQAKSLSDLGQFFNHQNYLTQTSDIQALLALEHQVEMHNIFTSTKFRIMHALHNEKVINEALGETGRRDITKRIMNNATEEILDYLLFVEESHLKNVDLVGIPSFQKDFKPEVPATKDGKSLTDFDFKNRISKYACSWLIYCDSFTGLPVELKEMVLGRLKKILTGENLDDKYIHLRKTRGDIHQILSETLPAYSKLK